MGQRDKQSRFAQGGNFPERIGARTTYNQICRSQEMRKLAGKEGRRIIMDPLAVPKMSRSHLVNHKTCFSKFGNTILNQIVDEPGALAAPQYQQQGRLRRTPHHTSALFGVSF
ncbi:hypothetical protein ES703_65474 [subsurface metagenome]